MFSSLAVTVTATRLLAPSEVTVRLENRESVSMKFAPACCAISVPSSYHVVIGPLATLRPAKRKTIAKNMTRGRETRSGEGMSGYLPFFTRL